MDGERMEQTRPAVFLDRDGTLIRDFHYLSDVSQVELLDGCVEGLSRLSAAGFALVMVTNQSGIARGLVTLDQMEAINGKIVEIFLESAIELDGIFYCPHHPDDQCDCRKPRVGMVDQANERLAIDVRKSWVIGDKCSDVGLGLNVGARAILLASGDAAPDLSSSDCLPTATVASFGEAVTYVLSH
jgi:histidinol-phosphate phosphatase family protein